MIKIAEERLISTNRDGQRKLQIFADSKDTAHQQILSRSVLQRVEKAGYQEYQHRRSLDEALPDVPMIP